MMVAPREQSGMMLSELLTDIAELPLSADREVSGLAIDSRLVTQGSLFLACSGFARHGLEFLQQALSGGAVAVVCEPDSEWDAARIDRLACDIPVPLVQVEGLGRRVSLLAGRFYGHPTENLPLVGITGTNGKTSCSQFLAQALAPEQRCAVIGTLGNGFLGMLKQGIHTTPDPVELQSALAGMRDEGADLVAMEVSSHALDQGRAEDLRFDIAVLTNLSRDHLDYHGTMESYEAAKRRLFFMPGLNCAVLNMDDAFGRTLAAELPAGVRCIGYAFTQSAVAGLDEWIHVTDLHSSDSGMSVVLRSSWGDGELTTSLLGRFNVSNLLAVLAVLLEQGVALDEALHRLSGVETVSGRMEHFGGGELPLVVVDFAHTPDALEHAITALRPHTAGTLSVVFGCGGDRDRGKRSEMGAVAGRLADRIWLTDDNPRSENGEGIIDEILDGMPAHSMMIIERDRGRAISDAIARSAPGDLVLVAGKGHEAYQQVGDLKLPFSDREQVRKALEVGR
ncbi:MAG: UDP-N-acetylmuramoyl-L-alanyl-D-glutamate--2,6-diaminopimelate ligase [Candidatus Sedimenticola sp. PURPLELP]